MNSSSQEIMITGDQKIDGLMPDLFSDWYMLPFEYCVEQPPGIARKLKQSEILSKGKFPVIDQGETFIAGYTDDVKNVYVVDLPLIVFGDHTRHLKYVDFSFAVGADGTKIIIPKTFFDRKFFFNFLKALQWQHNGYGRNFKYLKQIKVPLPPLNEQKRIVAKLDKIIPRIDSVKTRLDKIPVLIKRFRQAVLTAAVTGKLTEKWRGEHPEVESAEVLITNNKFEINQEFKEVSEIPEKWCWCALGNYAQLSRGRFSIRPRNDPRYFDGDYPFIQIGDLPREGGYINEHKQTLNEKGLKVSKEFERNTIAIAIVGATIGNTGILSYKMCFPDSLIGVVTKTKYSSIFIEYYLRTEKENIRNISYSSGGQPNIKLPVSPSSS
jgi:restriction endonuclease S subunit